MLSNCLIKCFHCIDFFFLETMAVRYELCVGLNKGHKTTKVKNVKYTGDKKVKGLRGSRLKNVSI